MNIINVPKDVKIAVISDIHEHEFQFNKAIAAIKPSEKVWAISVGDIFEKGGGIDCANNIISTFMDLANKGYGFVVQGNHDIKVIKKAKKDKVSDNHIDWMNKCPLSYSFKFCNGRRLTVIHGGVTPKMTESDLDNNTDLCYIRWVDSAGNYVPYVYKMDGDKKMMIPARKCVSWHEVYNGRFGTILSGHHSQKDGIPKFYSNSANLDSAVYVTGRLTVQMFDENGLGDLLFFDGPARYKGADEYYKSIALQDIR